MRWRQEPDLKLLTATAALARAAVTERPTRADHWRDLAHVLIQLGDAEEAAQCLTEGVARFPDAARLRLALARVQFTLGNLEAALDQVSGCLAVHPDDSDARILHFELLVKTGQWTAAEAAADEVSRRAPLHRYLLPLRSRSGDPEALLTLCSETLDRAPAHTNARYYKARALADLGRRVEAHAVMALDTFANVSELATPHGYDDGAAFRAALEMEILANPTLAPDPRGKATRHGLQTRVLRQPGARAVEALIGQIQRAVDGYDALLTDSPDGFASGRPRAARLKAWAVVCGPEGHQRSHRHPAGWLSGVFYVAAPRDHEGGPFQGSLILGASDSRRDLGVPPWGLRAIEPIPGRLVMFPSFTPHATAATGTAGTRISVAFDVVGADGVI